MSSTPRVLMAALFFSAYIMSIECGHHLSETTVSSTSVDHGKFWRRMFGAEEVRQHQEGYNRGRVEEIQRRATSFGAGLAIVIIACLIVWGLTAYGSWRLHHIRRGARPSGMPVMPAQMTAPMMPVMSPQPLPMGPKLVSQRVVGNAPPGFQPGAVRVA